MTSGVDQQAFRYVLGQIKDGDIFERFGLDILSKVMSYEFVPAGGLKDRGIDGLEHTFHRKGLERTIYQLSIEADSRGKIRKTLDKLTKNRVKYDQFVYVTNIPVVSKDLLADEMVVKYKVAVSIFDEGWLTGHINDSAATIQSYQIFVDSYLHEFNKPGKSYEVANLTDDPRLYVFLRQQVEQYRGENKLDEIVVDTLILYALEETDPEREIWCTKEEILDKVKGKVTFDTAILSGMLEKRLKALSVKPRRVHYTKSTKAYSLDYQERLAIKNRNLNDLAIYESFRNETMKQISDIGWNNELPEENCFHLIEELLNALFYKQGIEFADFVLLSSNKDVFEKSLPDIVSGVVDSTRLKLRDKQKTKASLLTVIRIIVYQGTANQQVFLHRLSQTYMMLFLLQCDPKLCTYFNSLASKLRVYVCSSIIIPAMSEQFLDDRNRRYANLLLGAKHAGVKLWINETILRELAAHFRRIQNVYQEEYQHKDAYYADESTIPYVSEIMIRAYYHSKVRGQVSSFNDFIGRFVSPSMHRIEENLTEWLNSRFGIEYASNSSLGIHLDKEKLVKIVNELTKYKQTRSGGAEHKATNDAEVMLAIHDLRDRDNESGATGIFGFKTWWLTTDVTTERAAQIAAGSKFVTTCYMRPDFLYNYISLAPKKGQIDQTFGAFFPTLLGVNVSFSLPEDVTRLVHKYIEDHKQIEPPRMKATLRELADELKQHPEYKAVEYSKRFFKERLG